MRTSVILAAVVALGFASAEAQNKARGKESGKHTDRVEQTPIKPDSTVVQPKATSEPALDSVKQRLSQVTALVVELSQRMAATQAVDSMMQVLCNEIDLLKLDNQLLQARLAAGQTAYASNEDGEIITPERPAGSSEQLSVIKQNQALESEPNLKFSGYVDAAGSFDNSSHKTDLTLNQVQLDLEHSVSERASFQADVEVISNGADGYVLELEQGFVRVAPTSSKNWQLYFGRFNSPIGIERLDPDQIYLYTRGFLFDNALPTNLTGIKSTLKFGELFDLALMAVNGWNINADNNTGKSVATRFGITPRTGLNVGISVMSGPEVDDDNSSIRTIFDLDATLSTSDNWNLALELHRGQETHNPEAGGGTARWNGAMLVGHSTLSGRFCITARADYFNDLQGSRTGQTQELKGLAVAPAYSIVDGLDMILELRENWSNRASLGSGESSSRSAFSSALEFTYSF